MLQERGHKVELARVAMKRALTKAAGTPVSADMLHASEIAPPEKVMVTSDEDDRHVYWCVKTALKFGVDKQLATLDSCSPERECYDG